MHEVRETLGRRGIDPREYLSEATLTKCQDAEFWRNVNQGYDAEDFVPDVEQVKVTDEPTNLIGV
jgi:hypothetical protein